MQLSYILMCPATAPPLEAMSSVSRTSTNTLSGRPKAVSKACFRTATSLILTLTPAVCIKLSNMCLVVLMATKKPTLDVAVCRHALPFL